MSLLDIEASLQVAITSGGAPRASPHTQPGPAACCAATATTTAASATLGQPPPCTSDPSSVRTAAVQHHLPQALCALDASAARSGQMDYTSFPN